MSGTKGWFLDLANTSDEVLLLLAREAASLPARNELTCRYWHEFAGSLARRPLGRRLTGSEREDAQQQAFFWIQEAISAYDPLQLSDARGSSFRTFLQRVFRLRLADFSRSLGRSRKRFCALTSPDLWPTVPDGGASGNQTEDLQRQLSEALTRLDPPVRALWNELRQGKRLRDLPAILAVSYRTIKRRWRKLREQLLSACRRLEQRRPRRGASHTSPPPDEESLSPFSEGGE